jgi:hypothetical protein
VIVESELDIEASDASSVFICPNSVVCVSREPAT